MNLVEMLNLGGAQWFADWRSSPSNGSGARTHHVAVADLIRA